MKFKVGQKVKIVKNEGASMWDKYIGSVHTIKRIVLDFDYPYILSGTTPTWSEEELAPVKSPKRVAQAKKQPRVKGRFASNKCEIDPTCELDKKGRHMKCHDYLIPNNILTSDDIKKMTELQRQALIGREAEVVECGHHINHTGMKGKLCENSLNNLYIEGACCPIKFRLLDPVIKAKCKCCNDKKFVKYQRPDGVFIDVDCPECSGGKFWKCAHGMVGTEGASCPYCEIEKTIKELDNAISVIEKAKKIISSLKSPKEEIV